MMIRDECEISGQSNEQIKSTTIAPQRVMKQIPRTPATRDPPKNNHLIKYYYYFSFVFSVLKQFSKEANNKQTSIDIHLLPNPPRSSDEITKINQTAPSLCAVS
jgi:hypothetical protein